MLGMLNMSSLARVPTISELPSQLEDQPSTTRRMITKHSPSRFCLHSMRMHVHHGASALASRPEIERCISHLACFLHLTCYAYILVQDIIHACLRLDRTSLPIAGQAALKSCAGWPTSCWLQPCHHSLILNAMHSNIAVQWRELEHCRPIAQRWERRKQDAPALTQ